MSARRFVRVGLGISIVGVGSAVLIASGHAAGIRQAAPKAAVQDVLLNFATTRPLRSTYPKSAHFVNSGSAGTEVAVGQVVRNGESFTVVRDKYSGDQAVRTPPHSTSAAPPTAVLRVQNAGSGDALDPGTRDFSFGTDFVLEANSSTPGSADDGDNLIQRGLFGAGSQYKIQIDDGIPTCRIHGLNNGRESGFVVSANRTIVRGNWYHVACGRTVSGGDTTLTISLKRYVNGRHWTVSTARAGSFDLSADATLPLTIGGKLGDDDLPIEGSSDQFNGNIDNAFLEIP